MQNTEYEYDIRFHKLHATPNLIGQSNSHPSSFRLSLQLNRQLQSEPTTEIQSLQEELIACKLREAEANLSMKELRQKVTDLEKYWQVSATAVRTDSIPCAQCCKVYGPL